MIKPEDEYPGQVAAADSNYPYGGPKNESSPGSLDGTPYEAKMLGDIWGFLYGILKGAGDIEPSGTSDTAVLSQALGGLMRIFTGWGTKYTITNSGNAYTFTKQTGAHTPPVIFDGMKAWGYVNAANTDAVTVVVAGFASKSVKKNAGVDALVSGDWAIGDLVKLKYDLSLDVWNWENHDGIVRDVGGVKRPVGFNVSVPNLQNAAYSFLLSDAGKTVEHSESTARAWTIEPDATTNFPIGTIIGLENFGSGAITLTRGAGVTLYLFDGSGTPPNANRTLTSGGAASIRKTAANTWRVVGNGGLS